MVQAAKAQQSKALGSSAIDLANGQEVAAKKLARLFHFQRAADPRRDTNAVTKGRQGMLDELRDYDQRQADEKVKSTQAKAADFRSTGT